MVIACPRCGHTDDRWVRIMADVALRSGGAVDLYRHRGCKEIVAVTKEPVAV